MNQWVWLAAAGVIASPASAKATDEPTPLFASDAPIKVTIQGPMGSLVSNRKEVARPGTMTVDGVTYPIALTPRGITRKTSDTCDFPPLRVELTSPAPAGSLFDHQRKLKLVTHCKRDSGFQQKVLLEYSAYRMYNLLTPHSFRARLANIDYVGADGRPIVSRIGYFLEDLGDLARRNGMKQTRAPNLIPIADLSPPDAARYALFQDMIANHDWSMRAGPAGKECCHNAELIGPLGPGSTVPVPYDFDFSGLVDAPYATPPDELHIGSVRERVYRGYCVHNADALAIARQMRDERPQLMAAITSTPGMQPDTASRAISYLDGFFTAIANDDSVNKLLRRCVA